MLLSVFLFSTLFAHAQPLIDGGQGSMSDTQYLHLLLADEKQSRMQLQAQVNNMEGTMNSMQDRIAELEEISCASSCQNTPTVAFMAQLSSSIVNPAQGRTIIFDQVVTNKGNAYNPAHGVFTAPFNGTYNFNIIVSAPPNAAAHWLHLFIKKNNAEVGYVFLDDNDKYWLRRSTDVTIHVLQGEEVWVDVDAVQGSHTIGGCCFHTHFSGFLIGTD